jgi:hypothetical protein
MIGGVSATNVTVLNATTITATTPAHASGSTSVEVTTPGGANGANTLFTYESPAASLGAPDEAAPVDIAESRRVALSTAAQDASVGRTQGAQRSQARLFSQAQLQNISDHLEGVRHDFRLRPNHFGIQLHIPSMEPFKPLMAKLAEVGLGQSGSASAPAVHRVVAKDPSPFAQGDQRVTRDDKAAFEHRSLGVRESPSIERDPERFSLWSAGTIDAAWFSTDDQPERARKIRVDGLTFGLDYKAGPRAIVGAAFGLGYGSDTSAERLGTVKSNQRSLTGYGLMGFGDGWVLDGLLGYGSQHFRGDRTLSDGLATLTFSRPGRSAFLSGGVSKVFDFQPWRMALFLREDVTKIRLNRYEEVGIADHALGYQSMGSTSSNASAGLSLSKDMYLGGGRLTTSAKLSANRGYSNATSQGVFYADVGPVGGVYALEQQAMEQTFGALSLGILYMTPSGDGVDIGWMRSLGSNRDKSARLRFGVNFAL